MKTLALLRHAKAGGIAPGLGDFERSLAARGIEAAPRMGQAMRSLGLNPDLMLCSPAWRARETWDLVAPELDRAPQVQFHRVLYLAAPGALLNAVRGAEPPTGALLLIGHNPGLEYLAGALCGPHSDPGALRAMAGNFPTAGLAVLTFDIASWLDIEVGQGRLTHFLRPGDHG